ncbi:hypothetical protein RB619_19190 [Flavobacterium sp. LHD-80]|uniref:hypothetical protein n=1 Tax=Flavobacterium sp. LHD-80 TaxID=3071411 RepID=UPI0027E1BC30|nr:hypothetical protein [Flavobacterium sp. LHD-80]MDQ6472770.1 hypothetical protein [Flavobacterium sp. LHD-80]
MSYFESYLDEDLLNEDYFSEDLLSEDLLESYDESYDEASKKRPFIKGIKPNVSSAVKQRSNFGKALSGRANDYATKSELKKSLDAISNQVNELKKTSIATNKTLVALDQKHTELAKIDARKGDNQTKVLKNMQMMSMMGSLLNQPKLVTENLEVTGTGTDTKIVAKDGKNPIYIDQTMSLLLPMMTTMGDSGSGKSDNSNMMLPLVLIMSQQNQGNTANNNNILPIALMMMMNK